jgi:hypothetical protein
MPYATYPGVKQRVVTQVTGYASPIGRGTNLILFAQLQPLRVTSSDTAWQLVRVKYAVLIPPRSFFERMLPPRHRRLGGVIQKKIESLIALRSRTFPRADAKANSKYNHTASLCVKTMIGCFQPEGGA